MTSGGNIILMLKTNVNQPIASVQTLPPFTKTYIFDSPVFDFPNKLVASRYLVGCVSLGLFVWPDEGFPANQRRAHHTASSVISAGMPAHIIQAVFYQVANLSVKYFSQDLSSKSDQKNSAGFVYFMPFHFSRFNCFTQNNSRK